MPYFWYMPKKFFLDKKLNVLQLIMACSIVATGLYVYNTQSTSQNAQSSTVEPQQMRTITDNKYTYTRPLRYVDVMMPSQKMDHIKKQITETIGKGKSNGELFQASVYISDLATGEWTAVNEQEGYHPGSLIKVPMMIHYLKRAEKNPAILDQKIRLPHDAPPMPSHTFKSKTIQRGQAYTVRQLLEYMIIDSDNYATLLLNTHCNIEEFTNMFSELNLSKPNITDTNYAMTIKEYSVFLRVLYDATLLNSDYSDYALSLLSRSTFDIGLTSKLPQGTIVARKYGEYMIDRKRELHESGIVYCNQKPYLVTVMTKGYNAGILAGVISQISTQIYTYFCN